MEHSELLIGQVLEYLEDPFVSRETAFRFHARGAVLVQNGYIADVGPVDEMRTQYPQAPESDYRDRLILPGFIDAHVHYPQTGIIASWGKRLIDWLNTYTFPEEMKFGDADYAKAAAKLFFDLSLSNGTTTVASFCTIHPESVDGFFEQAKRLGVRAVAGKTCMDRNAPEGLRDTVQTAYDDSKMLLNKWHGQGRLTYAIAPRFSPTSTREQLEALGSLWSEYPDCPMQTHLSEQTDEVAWVKELFPEARDYLDTYESTGLLRPGGLFGHAIHLTERERSRIKETDCALIHCPTSNTFIGSGLFDTDTLSKDRHRIGLATDTGGGSSFSMLRTMASAYEIGQLRGRPLHPSELLWLATAGSAQALRMETKIGRIAKGFEADLIVVDLASTPLIAQRSSRANDIWEALFPTIMMGDDRAIHDVRVMGKSVKN